MKNLLLILALVLSVGCDIIDPVGVDIKSGQGPSPIERGELDLENLDTTGATASGVRFMLHGKIVKAAWNGKVVAISDGDTITVLNSANEQIKVRLESIDTPESKQPFGELAKDALASMIHQKSVVIHETGKDRYGRTLGFVQHNLDDFGVAPIDVNAEMVRQGYAWNYVAYSKSESLPQAEREARAAKRGLWSGQSDQDQIPPRLWRKKVRSRKEITLPNGDVMTNKQFNDRAK